MKIEENVYYVKDLKWEKKKKNRRVMFLPAGRKSKI